MKFIVIFFCILAVSNCSSVSRVKSLIEQVRYTDSAADLLKNATGILIEETKIEFGLLLEMAAVNINQTVEEITNNVNIIFDYSVNRTSDLVSYLLGKIEQAQNNSTGDSRCLTTLDILKTFNQNSELRTELALFTSVRVANTTIRQDVTVMNKKFDLVISYGPILNSCDSDLQCIVNVSTQVVLANDDFLKRSNSLTQNIRQLPALALSEALIAANQTVYEDEDYACENADLILYCLNTFDDDEDGPTTTETPMTTTEIPSNSTDIPPTTTTASVSYCKHDPFVPIL